MHQRITSMSLLGSVLLAVSLTTLLQSNSSSPLPPGSVNAFIPASASSRVITRPSASKVSSTPTKAFASSFSPEVHESAQSFLNSSEILQKKRQKLKRRLLDAADEYKIQRQIDELFDENNAMTTHSQNEKHQGEYSVARLLRRIVSKIVGKNHRNQKKTKSVITTDKFRQKTLDIGDEGRAIIDLAEELIKLNPTPNPTNGFKGYGGGDPANCKLGGMWKLRFTTAADASFDRNDKRGKITTSQEIDCNEGTLTNVVDFERGKLQGFRVVVEGTPVNDSTMDLSFKRVDILRQSRLPRFFGKLSFRLPSRLIRRLNRDRDARGPYLTIKYLDDDLRIHQSGTGNYFIQSRIQ